MLRDAESAAMGGRRLFVSDSEIPLNFDKSKRLRFMALLEDAEVDARLLA
jgi:hypothetical protein